MMTCVQLSRQFRQGFRPVRKAGAGRRTGLVSGAMAGLAMAVTVSASPAGADDGGLRAHATLHDRGGAVVGEVDFAETPTGLLVEAHLVGLPPGTHAFHLHARGRCEGDFKSAGGHFNPDKTQHGFLSPEGPHAGDMPNIHVPASGSLTVEVFLPERLLVGQGGLMDEDGAALVIHEGADDYRSQPAGAAGKRIACGVIELAK